jgi:acetyl esterase/lipase
MSVLSNMFAYAIQKLVFEPPITPGYLEREATYVRTKNGLRIAMKIVQPEHLTMQRAAPLNSLIDLGIDFGEALAQPVVSDKPRPLLLYSHGNAEDLGTTFDHLQWLATNLDCDVLVYDYVGYGHSSVALMSEANMYEAIQAVYEHAAHRITEQSSNSCLFLMGRSLGSTASTRLARLLSEQQVDTDSRLFQGLILLSPLASGFRVLFRVGDGASSLYSMLDRLFCPVVQDIQSVRQGVLIIHGMQDQTIDIRNAYEIQAHVPMRSIYPPLYVDAGHNDIDVLHGTRMLMHIKKFMRHCHQN